MQERLPTNFRNNEDVKYGMLRVVDIPNEVAANAPWFNQTLTTVNEAVVRLGISRESFPGTSTSIKTSFSSSWTAK